MTSTNTEVGIKLNINPSNIYQECEETQVTHPELQDLGDVKKKKSLIHYIF